MLHIIKDLNDPLIDLIKDDPVRPSIPTQLRVHDHAEVMVLRQDMENLAVVCVAYLAAVPKTENELGLQGDQVAAFYTIWSYRQGAGQQLIRAARSHIGLTRPKIQRFVTLSPKTEMARRFHIKNGATVLSDNEDSVNYEYN